MHRLGLLLAFLEKTLYIILQYKIIIYSYASLEFAISIFRKKIIHYITIQNNYLFICIVWVCY